MICILNFESKARGSAFFDGYSQQRETVSNPGRNDLFHASRAGRGTPDSGARRAALIFPQDTRRLKSENLPPRHGGRGVPQSPEWRESPEECLSPGSASHIQGIRAGQWDTACCVDFPARYTPAKIKNPPPAIAGERTSPKSHQARSDPIKGSPKRQAETSPALR